jgi:hypothetical protein
MLDKSELIGLLSSKALKENKSRSGVVNIARITIFRCIALVSNGNHSWDIYSAAGF